MVHRVDARGLACPQPVINASKALETNDTIIVIVDNQSAFENIQRLAKSRGCSVTDEKKTDGIYMVLEKQGNNAALNEHDHGDAITCATREGRILLISQDVMGKGDDALGAVLMKSFFHTLAETDPAPDTIIFFNSGVKLLAEGSEVIDDITMLEKKGKRIIACGTCLDYFNLKQSLRAGTVSNMYEIKELMITASSTISL